MNAKLIASYKSNFKEFGLPTIIEEMLNVDEFIEESGIASGFMFYKADSNEVHSSMWSISSQKREEVLSKLIFLAQADGTGSIYSIIRFNETSPIEDNPIVFLGSEGEVLFAAANLNDWLRIISTGVEPNAFDTPIKYILDEDEIGDSTQDYRKWLKSKGISPIVDNQEEVDALITKADIYIPKIIDFLNNL